MAVIELTGFGKDNPITRDIERGRISIWMFPDLRPEIISRLAIPVWSNVWNFNEQVDFLNLYQAHHPDEKVFRLSDFEPGAAEATFYTRIYELPSKPGSPFSSMLRKIKIDQLKLSATDLGGTLFLVGNEAVQSGDISLLAEIAPQLQFCVVPIEPKLYQGDAQRHDVYLWRGGIDAFLIALSKYVKRAISSEVIDLKDARSIPVPRSLIAELGDDWTLLTSKHITRSIITQPQFDRFLNGEPEWAIYVAKGAYLRTLVRSLLPHAGEINVWEEIRTIILDLDNSDIDPRDALRQLIVFAEAGSGATTFLRQQAVLMAQMGYPTVITNPMPRNLRTRSLGEVVGSLQDLWRERKGHGSGRGRLPVAVFVDKDAEDLPDSRTIARSLGSIGREVLLVRAFERSRDEMRDAKGALLLPSAISEPELLALGDHLRSFAKEHSLTPLPSTEEWRAYHRGLSQLARYSPAIRSTDLEEIPHLFLIGIQPFISERITDANSIEQYYFQKWDRIERTNLKSIIHVVAAAGVFGLSVPYNALRRCQGLDLTEIESPHSTIHRSVEIFLEWKNQGTNVQGWYLRVRHPVIGRLLCRAVDPIEGEVPFRPMLELLAGLTTKADDLWFAESLAFRVAQNFKSGSPGFSLETDTPIQKAARAIFDAIPVSLKDVSRVIAHHEARYHIHLIHACLEALRDPTITTLTEEQIRTILDHEVETSGRWLDKALTVRVSVEPESNIFNTYARLKFEYAETFRAIDALQYRTVFEEGINWQEKAVEGDATNGFALYQFVEQIIGALPDAEDWPFNEQLDLLSRAEVRLSELIRLHEERRWRNIDPVEAEVQLGTLLTKHIQAIRKIPNLEQLLSNFRVTNAEAALRIQIRLVLEDEPVPKAFSNPSKSTILRQLRQQLSGVPNKTPRGIIYLYRLFLSDPVGRLEFKARLELLLELKRKSLQQFTPYWHDEAALFCQLDNLQTGARRFAEIRAYRQANQAQWFWLNERILLRIKDKAEPRQIMLTVIDPDSGWVRVHNTDIRLRYQPAQFTRMNRGQAFPAYIRFTIYGLQAIPESLAKSDIQELHLA
jgi:hypothetical protein